jgi:hypothetical protein
MKNKKISDSKQAIYESSKVALSDEDRLEKRKMCSYKTSSIQKMTERSSVPLWVNRRKRKAK